MCGSQMTSCQSHFSPSISEGSGDGTQIINLGGNYLYLLSHLDWTVVSVLVFGLVFEIGSL